MLSADSVLLNWNATTGQFIANFSVELSVDSVTWEQPTCNHSLVQGACVVTQKQAVIISLAPYTNYTFRVVAKSQYGRSNYSAESGWVVTDEAGIHVYMYIVLKEILINILSFSCEEVNSLRVHDIVCTH